MAMTEHSSLQAFHESLASSPSSAKANQIAKGCVKIVLPEKALVPHVTNIKQVDNTHLHVSI
jgi:hypothetical protein